MNTVCPATEIIYSDEFYTKQDIIITALDNVEARRYVDRYVLEIQVHKELLSFLVLFFTLTFWKITKFSGSFLCHSNSTTQIQAC